MYLYCESCGLSHKDLLMRDAGRIARAFIEGDAQIVTREGVKNLCLLDVLGRPPTQRKLRQMEKAA